MRKTSYMKFWSNNRTKKSHGLKAAERYVLQNKAFPSISCTTHCPQDCTEFTQRNKYTLHAYKHTNKPRQTNIALCGKSGHQTANLAIFCGTVGNTREAYRPHLSSGSLLCVNALGMDKHVVLPASNFLQSTQRAQVIMLQSWHDRVVEHTPI